MIEKLHNLDDRIVRIESKLDDRNDFQLVRRGSKVETGVSYTIASLREISSIYWKTRFMMSLTRILVGDSLIWNQDEEFLQERT